MKFTNLKDLGPGLCYRSGDLARLLENGEIEYIGRMDSQVQLRGFRIELGEVQASLESHPKISSAHVVMREDVDGDRALCAFFVSSDELSVTDLRWHCSQFLPQYMVPSYFVRIDRIPVTNNGKVSIEALPKVMMKSCSCVEYIAPKNEFQVEMSKVWAGILRIPPPSVNANFFEIGGDSMKALRVVSRMKGRLNLVDIFKWQTIEGIDMNKNILADKNADKHLVALVDEANQANLAVICVPFGGGDPANFYAVAQQLRSLRPDIDVYSLRLPGYGPNRINGELPRVQELAGKCVAEIRERLPSIPVALYGHCVGSALAVEMTRQLESVGTNPRALIVAATLPPSIDPEKPVLDVWEKESDHEILQFLSTLGNFQCDASEDMLEMIIQNFRYDVFSYRQYFHEVNQTSNVIKPLTPSACIMGNRDLSAPDYKNMFTAWNAYVSNVQLLVIEDGDHYFNASLPQRLAEAIVETIKC